MSDLLAGFPFGFEMAILECAPTDEESVTEREPTSEWAGLLGI